MGLLPEVWNSGMMSEWLQGEATDRKQEHAPLREVDKRLAHHSGASSRVARDARSRVGRWKRFIVIR